MPKKIVFLDRDGTINVDKDYSNNIEYFEFEDGAVEGLKILTKQGYQLIVISNQSGVGRGYNTLKEVGDFNRHLIKELRKDGADIAKIYICPHSPDEECDCRKPKPGMIKKAEKDLGIVAKGSWLVGDKTDDIKLGIDAGCRTILVRTGKKGLDKNFDVTPEFTVDDLEEAAGIIMENDKE